MASEKRAPVCFVCEVCVSAFYADIKRQALCSEMNERADWTEADEVD